jgi:vancomycin permeability regulator SanA
MVGVSLALPLFLFFRERKQWAAKQKSQLLIKDSLPMRRIIKTLAAVFAVVLIVATAVALRIYSYRNTSPNVQADAAVVLGAAVWGRDVSPVFRERINHAINLYQAGRVKKLIFTGGQGNPGEQTEAAAARDYAIYSGVSAGDILLEKNLTRRTRTSSTLKK